MRYLYCLFFCLSLSGLCRAVNSNQLYSTGFGRDEWNADDWIFVKSPRWDYIGSWVQEDDHIRNFTPPDAEPDRLIADRHFYAYMSMVRNTPYNTGNGLEITVRMEFDYDQGPQIVLAGELGSNDEGYPEYREHYEIVLFARGINIWHHVYRDGKPEWARLAYARLTVPRRKAHDLTVRIEPPAQSRNGPASGQMLAFDLNGTHIFAFHAPDLPDDLYVGLTGYASINRFYAFKIQELQKK